MKQILLDLSLLYKNFVHWNISKVLILLFSLFLGIIFSLPFFALSIGLAYFDPVERKDIIYNFLSTQSIGLSLMTALSEHLFYIIIQGILVILAALVFMFGYSYKIITTTKLNFSYLAGEKLPYKKNIYFNIKKILTYLSVVSWIGVILLVPFLFFVVVFFVLLFSFGGIEEVSNMIKENGITNMFSILAGIFFVLSVLVFIYLAYRMSFAYVIMLDENYKKNEKGFFYVKESFRISSGIKIFKFLLFMIIFSILLIPIDYIGELVENSNFYSFLFGVIIFLVLNGVFEMLIVSIYKHIMIGENKEIV